MIGIQACVNHAAAGYHIPPAYIEMALHARHPTDGVGVSGIPPSWLPILSRYDFNISKVLSDPCANIDAAAWIIAQNPHMEPPGPGGEAASPPLPDYALRAETAYDVPDKDVRSVLEAKHRPGSYGPMGIPVAWMPLLEQYGFNGYMVEHNYQAGMIAGIWILGVEHLGGYNDDVVSGGYGTKFSVTPPADLASIYERAASRYALPVNLLYAVSAQESGFIVRATSSAGAMGLMQLMPGTASEYSVSNAYDPTQNIMGGAAYLADLEHQFNGNLTLVLAAYNAGSGAVLAYGGKIPPFAETQSYVPAVLARLRYYAQKFRNPKG